MQCSHDGKFAFLLGRGEKSNVEVSVVATIHISRSADMFHECHVILKVVHA
jgi:hypothetical protein